MIKQLSISDRAGAFARSVITLRRGPVPRSAMLRSGATIGIGFLIFLVSGSIDGAAICAFFTNFLCLCDRAEALATRVWVQVLGAILSAAAGAVGVLVSGNEPLILVTTFAFALFAGFVHGTTPGVEAIPRYALLCFVVSAFLPVGVPETFVAILIAMILSTATVIIDDRIRNGHRGRLNARARGSLVYPGPRFSVIYGAAAVAGLAFGVLWSHTRPYWVTITTLVVMQPDRRANTVRVMQRFLGTLCGVVLAFAIVQFLPVAWREKALLLLVVTLPFFWPLGFDRNYGLGVAILSTWVLILIDLALPSGDFAAPIFLARLSETSIGCALALAGSFVVYETRDPVARA